MSTFARWSVSVLLLGAATGLTPRGARAAEITDVADAADTVAIGEDEVPNPWDLRVGTAWDSFWGSGVITREPVDRPNEVNPSCNENSPRCAPVPELAYTRRTVVQTVRLEAGVYHDLSLVADLPIVYSDTLAYHYAPGVTAATSSVDTGDPATSLFPHNFVSWRNGLGPMGVALRWGATSDERDAAMPAWVMTVRWQNPATSHTNRFALTRQDAPGPVGDGLHRLSFSMAFSKRLGWFGLLGGDEGVPRRGFLEPYMEFAYTLPIPAAGRAVQALSPSAGNPFGDRSSHVGQIKAGVEWVGYENLRTGRKLSFDVGMRSAYFSEARNYTPLSDPLQRATFSEQYMHVSGYLGVAVQPASVLKLRLGVGLGYDTEHWLTNEVVGLDANGDGRVTEPDLDGNAAKDQLNPYACGNDPADLCRSRNVISFDRVGARFRDTQHFTVSAQFSATLLF
ncbi:MAG TPA: hypothetical protein VFH51_12695 [Myxococcota bacterium]|nr:hypothetical protein [Myxococcota bacterium]